MSLVRLDHLVYASPDLQEGVRRVEALLGVRAEPGGRHPGRGTRNALVGLGVGAYLEIVGVDPEQAAPARPRWFGLDTLSDPRLVTWAARVPDVVAATGRARAAGGDLGAARAGSRLTEAGGTLRWTFSDPDADRLGGVIPFVIDWGTSRHPSAGLSSDCWVESLRIEHPQPALVRALLGVLDVETAVEHGPEARLEATLRGPVGTVTLS